LRQLILASTSAARAAMLRRAGLSCDVMAPMVDEEAIKSGLLAEGVPTRDVADALAEAKAVKLSGKYPGAMVMGADQMLELDDGTTLDKPQSPDEAVAHLGMMSGKTHKLLSAIVVAEAGQPVWRFVATSRLLMRPLSQAFISNYVAQHWEDIRHCVGCYQIEGAGAQLFTHIKGTHFDIMGLPLLPLLGFLRERGLVEL
jgi:septum formation protein